MNAIRKLSVGVAVALALIGTGVMVHRAAANGPDPCCVTPPSITSHPPTNYVQCGSASVTFTSAATGNPTPTAQWYVRTNESSGWVWVEIPNANTPTLTFTPNAGDDGKQYHVKFENCCTSRTSSNVTLTVASLDSVGDGILDCWRQQYFGGDGTTTNTNSCASCNPDGDGFSNLQEFLRGTDPTNSLSGNLLLACPGTVIVVADSGTNVASHVNLGQPALIGCGNASFTSNLPASFVIGSNTVVWTGICGSAFTSQCSQTVIVLVAESCTTVPGTNASGIQSISLVAGYTYAYQASGCISWNTAYSSADPEGIMSSTNCSAPFIGQVTAGTGFSCEGLTAYSLVGKIGGGSCTQLGTKGSFVAPTSGSLVLYFNDDNFGDNINSWDVCITPLGLSGVTLVAPTNGQTFAAHESINLAVNAYSATGTITKVQFFDYDIKIGESTTSPYYYIWPGANVPAGSHLVTAAASTSLGNFYVSNVVTINVASAFSVAISTNGVLCTGSTATFVATPTGTGPFTYMWRQNANMLSGQTSNILALTDISTWDAGTITVLVNRSGSNAAVSTTLTVSNPPVASDQSVTTRRGELVPIHLTGSDPGNAPLTYTNMSGPMHGTLSSMTGSNLTYTPASDFVGTDTFTFKVNNGTCDSAPATLSIQVLENIWLLFFNTFGGGAGIPDLSLMITSASTTTGTVSYAIDDVRFDRAFGVTAGAVANVDIPASMMITNYDIIEDKGIHVTATQPVSVYAMNYRPGASEAFTAFSASMFGTSYCLLGRQSGARGAGCFDEDPGTTGDEDRSQFAIVATEINTTVTISPSSKAHLIGHSATFSTNLNQGQTYQLASMTYTDDVTGTLITSDKPIEVLAGARMASIPDADAPGGGEDLEQAVNPLMEEQLPVSSWGRKVLALPFANYYASFYRVLAANNNTVVRTNGVVLTTLQSGGFTDIIQYAYEENVSDGPMVFEGTNGPIQVAQFSMWSGGDPDFIDEIGDASGILLPPVGHYSDTYSISVPNVFSEPTAYDDNQDGNPPYNSLTLIVEKYAIPATTVDGLQVPPALYVPIGVSGYYGARFPVTPGVHTVHSSRPLGVLVYGFRLDDAYSYNAGVTNRSNVAIFAVADVTNAPPLFPVSIDVLTNDLFLNRTGVTVSIASAPLHGTAVPNLDKTITYTPTNGYGDDHFTYQIVELGQTSAAPVAVLVTNSPPVANVDSNANVVVCRYDSVVLNVLANDTDTNEDLLSILSVTQPGGSHVEVNLGNTITFHAVSPGTNSFTYTITDGRGGSSIATVYVAVDFVQANDHSASMCGTRPVTIQATEASSSSIGGTLTFSYASNGGFGQVAIINGGTSVIYTPGPGFAGSDQFTYTITDGRCAGSGTISVTAYNPCANWTVYGNASCAATVPILTNGACSGANVTQSPSPGTSVTHGQTNVVVTTISNGSTSVCVVSIMVLCTNGTLYSGIDDLATVDLSPLAPQPLIINDGFLIVTGSVYQTSGNSTNSVKYDVVITDNEGSNVLDSGWFPPALITHGVINTNDLTLLQNGVYDLHLIAGNDFASVTTTVSFVVGGSVKIGQFGFSQQDIYIPVSGVPITVTRTYNSQNPDSSDFGYGWTYTLADLDVQIDETRLDFGHSDDSGSNSVRVGGGRDITLTLPDGSGRRATFAFRRSACGIGYCDFEWDAPPGVHYTLQATGTTRRLVTSGGILYWSQQDESHSSPEQYYDLPEFILTAPDGTRYDIAREDLDGHFYDGGEGAFWAHPYSSLALSNIVLRDGSSMTFATSGVTHHPSGKTIKFVRDDSNRITAIYDPESLDGGGNTNGPPAAAYVYSSGNLVAVSNLVSRSPLQYNVTRYIYDNAQFPHYITEIKDPRGISPLKNLYDNNGRLYAVVDAFGKTNNFAHDVAHQTETVTDRLGNQTILLYDARGNVTTNIDALGNVTARTYDDNNNMLTESDAVGKTTYTYDGSGNRKRIIDPLGHTNGFTYEVFNNASTPNVLTHTDALNRVTFYSYTNGNLLATIDPAGNITSNVYDSAGNRIIEYQMFNSVAILTTNRVGYDGSGYLTNVVDALGHSTGYTNDANGNQLSEKTTRTHLGNTETLTTSHVYDGQNRLIKTIDPLGFTNEIVYNAIGKQDRTIDKLGRVTGYEYDDMGRLTKVTYPDYTFESYGYDAGGRRTSTTDRGSHTTSSTYDAVGRQILTIYPDGATVSNTCDAVGRLIATTDARTNTTIYVYDAAGRRTEVTNSLPQATKFDYDAVGNLIKTTDALSRVVSNVYDRVNRITNVVYLADNPVTTQQTIYDALGRRTAQIDQAGITNRFGYDKLGRLTSVTNALNKVTRYEYDELGNLLRQIDALIHTNKFEYDKLGRCTKHTLPGNQFETFAYDANGNQISHTDFNGHTTVMEYDTMNRLTRKTPDSALQESPVTFTYTSTGVRSTMTDTVGTTAYTCDLRNRLTTKAMPIGTLTYGYDFNGNLRTINSSTAIGTTVEYQYDALNRLRLVIDTHRSQNLVTTNAYDAVGNLQSNVSPNGVVSTYRYDGLNRLTNMMVRTTTASSGTNIFAYTLGPSGNRTNVSETINSSRTRQVSYGYDALYRLTNETIGADSGGPAGNIGYTFNSAGNRLSRTTSGAVPTLVPSATYSYDANDRLTNDLYDANGNTTNSAGNPYRYDFENRLTNYKNRGAVYVYDGDGHRVEKESRGTNTFYLVDDRNPTGYEQVLEEYDSANGGPTNLARVYTYGTDLISLDRNTVGSSWTLRYYGYDGHGNTRLLTAGSVTLDSYTYDAFGILLTNTGASVNNYRYCGEQNDPELNLYYLRARYMNPGTGRFWTGDTFEGRSEDPLSLHKYLYAADDPVDSVDPSGNDIEAIMGAMEISALLGALPNVAVVSAINNRVSPKVGIGIEPVDPAAVENGVLNVAVDPGHTFVYVKQGASVVSILSFGPGAPIGAANKNQFLKGTLPGNAHWPLSGNINTWELPITSAQMESEKQAITDFKNHVPNYTPQIQCTSAALTVAGKSGASLPDGVGPVIAREYGIKFWSGNVPNPFTLNQQMTTAHGRPVVANESSFPTP